MKNLIISLMLVAIALAVPAWGQEADEVEQLLGTTTSTTTTTVPATTTTTTVTTQPVMKMATEKEPVLPDYNTSENAAALLDSTESVDVQSASPAAAVDEQGKTVVGDENLIPLIEQFTRDRHGATFAVDTFYNPGKMEVGKIRADVLNAAADAYFAVPANQRPRIRVYAFADTIRYRGHHTEFNPALSIARLSPIVQYLNEKKGVPLDHIVYGFYSETAKGQRYTAVKVFRDIMPGVVSEKLVVSEKIVPGKPACNDGIDNDGDGKVDFPKDPGCENAEDSSEIDALKSACSDGADNDGDGLVDFPEDPGCVNSQDSAEDEPIKTAASFVPSESDWALFIQTECAWGFYPRPFKEKTFTGYDKQSANNNGWNNYQSFNVLFGIELRRRALLFRGAAGPGLGHVLTSDPAETPNQSQHNFWGFRGLLELGWDMGEKNDWVALLGGSFASLRPDDELDSSEAAFTAPHLTIAYRAALSETILLVPYLRGGYLFHYYQEIPDQSDVKHASGGAGSAGIEIMF